MLEKFRLHLATSSALPQLALMGVFSGLFAGIVILVFRYSIETIQLSYLSNPENYEQLNPLLRLFIPTLGGLLIGLLWQRARPEDQLVGVVHVMERLAYHQGHLPLRNTLYQFFGATVCLASGHSVGREGPSVHLGAASGSLLGQWLTLPNNSIRTLVACGTAAAIAASFNTPLAGVIFAMEVVMMEYTIAGFTPVIIAAVIGAGMSVSAYGLLPTFIVPPLCLTTPFLEMFYLVIVGVVIGLTAALFIHALQFFSQLWRQYALWQRTTAAGLLTGFCALFIPEVMGIGYDTVNAAFLGQLSLTLMIALVIFKIVLTTFSLGMGLPAGLIGPTLVIGTGIGGIMGFIAELLFPGQVTQQAMYAMLGMGAMMGATLQAPLAALTALLELTNNPNLILPGMLVIVVANLVANSAPLKKEAIFIILMRARGLEYWYDPVSQSLSRIGVAGVMERNVATLSRYLSQKTAETIIQNHPIWIIIEEVNQQRTLLRAADLARFLEKIVLTPHEAHDKIDLRQIPAERLQLVPIGLQASLLEALQILEQAEAIYVVQRIHPTVVPPIYGILTRQHIETYYRSTTARHLK